MLIYPIFKENHKLSYYTNLHNLFNLVSYSYTFRSLPDIFKKYLLSLTRGMTWGKLLNLCFSFLICLLGTTIALIYHRFFWLFTQWLFPPCLRFRTLTFFLVAIQYTQPNWVPLLALEDKQWFILAKLAMTMPFVSEKFKQRHKIWRYGVVHQLKVWLWSQNPGSSSVKLDKLLKFTECNKLL